jgi:hypothetical protein
LDPGGCPWDVPIRPGIEIIGCPPEFYDKLSRMGASPRNIDMAWQKERRYRYDIMMPTMDPYRSIP